MAQQKQGFTLLEFAIVVTIVGLMAGAIVVGQSLVHTAEVQSVIKEVDMFGKSIQEFRDKYGALPGDMIGAEKIWGSDTGCPATPYTSTSTIPHAATCDGNGNGLIGKDGVVSDENYESLRAWQQLANAGFIPGQYSGVAGPLGQFDYIVGINSPASQYPAGGYMLVVMTTGTHYLQFGADDPASNGSFDKALLTTKDALDIDLKIDDGMAGTGNVVSSWLQGGAYASNCATTSSASTAQYDTTRPGQQCVLSFMLGF